LRLCSLESRRHFALSSLLGKWQFGSQKDLEEQPSDEKKAVQVVGRVPETFVEDTLLPHLERQIWTQSPYMYPYQQQMLITAYAKLPVRQKILEWILAEVSTRNMKYWEARYLVLILMPMIKMQRKNKRFWKAVTKQIELVMDQDKFSTLNYMAIFRAYNMMLDDLKEAKGLLEKVVPKIEEGIKEYEAGELSDILVTIGDHAMTGDTKQDTHLVRLLLPEIERRYSETSLADTLNNLWALVRLRIYPLQLVAFAEEDFCNPKRMAGLPPKQIARVAWIWGRLGRVRRVTPVLLPLIEGSIEHFKGGDFARLTQALPMNCLHVLSRMAVSLSERLGDMPRDEFMTFVLGCVRGGFLPPSVDFLPPAEAEGLSEGKEADAGGEGKEASSSPSSASPVSRPREAPVGLMTRQDLMGRGVVFETDEPLAVSPEEMPQGEETALAVPVDRDRIKKSVLTYIEEEQDRFTNDEVKRLGLLFSKAPEYRYLLDELPPSWWGVLEKL